MWLKETPVTVATLRDLPPGPESAKETLRVMRSMVRAAVRDPSQRVRETALHLVADHGERKWLSEISALHSFVRDQIRYVRDPVGLESVATPDKTMDYRQGDCDDKSTLLAALLESIGHPARFVAVGFNGQPFSHVYVEALSGRNWIPLETIIQRPMGWAPEGVTSRYILKV